MAENAPKFRALQVFIEHRFYGVSTPFGLPMEEALKNETVRGFFNSAQALADYAEVAMYIKTSLDAENSPVIVFGGSYGGMLASWFRLKYPHIAIGALASSAPILNFADFTPNDGFYWVVTKDFKDASESCYATIRASWFEIDKIASQPNGLAILSQKFNSCSPLNDASELKDYLTGIYITSAQYNTPPGYPVTMMCGGIDGAYGEILDKIFAGVVAIYGNNSCHHINDVFPSDQTDLGWSWQSCSEMVNPASCGTDDTMFQARPFNFTDYSDSCKSQFGITPRPHWIPTYYGGRNIGKVLEKFGSNIIFSNGLKDPWSSGGVLEDISDSIHAIYTANGSHCLDILLSRPSDPDWLIQQRKREVDIITGWINKYYEDL